MAGLDLTGQWCGKLEILGKSSSRLHGKVAWDAKCHYVHSVTKEECGKIIKEVTTLLNRNNIARRETCGCHTKDPAWAKVRERFNCGVDVPMY